MELFVPFMLFVLKIVDEQPVHVVLERQAILFESQEECFAAADAMLDEIAREAHMERDDLRHWCLPMPDPSEFEQLIERRDAAKREGK